LNSDLSVKPKRLLGVTVQPMYFQSEGVEEVLDSLSKAGVNAIAISPSVYEQIEELPSSDAAGLSEELPRREPPVDGGAGSVRVVERLLWGKEQVLINPSPSAPPNMEFYKGLKYQPSKATAFTESDGGMIQQIIESAHARGMKVYFQLSAVQVPGAYDEDMPLLPNGEPPRQRMIETMSLASDDLRAYICARVKDLVTSYPEIDGLRHDWPEHPPYRLGDAFLDFSDNAGRAAGRLGFDFEAMRTTADELYKRLQHLSNDDLAELADSKSIPYVIAKVLARFPGLAEFLRFKAALTTLFIKELREALDSVSPDGRKDLSPNAFPPPLSLLSGMNFNDVSEYADSINMKLFTMHWPQMIRYYAEELQEHNDRPLDERLLVAALSNLFDFEDDETGTSLDDYRYPSPSTPHRAGTQAQIRKIRQAHAEVGDRANLYPTVHGYGPLSDFETKLRLAWDAGTSGIWINRYCYLGEQKIDAIGRLAKFSD
jgi:hypothetical protein